MSPFAVVVLRGKGAKQARDHAWRVFYKKFAWRYARVARVTWLFCKPRSQW